MPPPNAQIARARQAYAARRLAEAVSLCTDVLKREADHVEAIEVLGLVELEQRRIDEALERFRTCAKLRPEEPRYRYLTGRALLEQGASRDAIPYFDHALEAAPETPLYVYNKVVALERLGDYEEARTLLAPLVAGDDDPGSRAALFARLEMHAGRLDEAVAFLERHLARADLDDAGRQNLLYALGKAHDKRGDYDAAFDAHRTANELRPPRFDPAAYAAFVDRLLEVFAPAGLPHLIRSERRTKLPVFVVGMPRSGTTLVEQIVAAHPLGHGAGELPHLDRIGGEIAALARTGAGYPACVRDLAVDDANRIAGAYLAALRSIGGDAQRVVNKALTNFLHAGLIAVLWPGARIVFTQRDPRDVCVSCYLNPMNAVAHPYTKDLRHLAFVHRQHERLVTHWREVLDIPMMTLDYETFVEDPDPWIRELVTFLGLEWDDRCLRFFESGRAVMTPSYDQVNRPVYRGSVGRWKRYEKHLGPLLEALDA